MMYNNSMKRFWDKVNKTENIEDCWIWTGSIRNNNSSYGAFKYEGKVWLAHRFSFYLFHDKVPDNLVCHKCNNKLCVNPHHLYEGTHKDNHNDMVRAGNNFKPAKGLENPLCKTTPEQMKQITYLRNQGWGSLRIANELNISRTVVRKRLGLRK